MVIAVDFDGTICSDAWPKCGKPNYGVVSRLIQMQRDGHKIMLWTCRSDAMLAEAIEYCRELGLEFDSVNDRPNPDPDSEGYPVVSGLRKYRKVFADIYIDDRAMTPENFVSVQRIFEKGIDKTGEM